MAIGDIGMFLPSEAQYSRPGSYDDMLRAEASKRAAYLASMDQFYAELEQSKKQFSETMAWNRESFASTMSLNRDTLAQTKELKTAELALQKELGLADIGVKKEQLALEKNLGEKELSLKEKQLTLEKSKFSWQQESSIDSEDLLDLARERYGLGKYSSGSEINTPTPRIPGYAESARKISGTPATSSGPVDTYTATDLYNELKSIWGWGNEKPSYSTSVAPRSTSYGATNTRPYYSNESSLERDDSWYY